jgi:hypothetical protein
MPRTGLSDVYVVNGFKILRLLGVPQKAVCQLLKVAKPTVSAWATGTRPMPQQYVWRFFEFVSRALNDAMRRLSQDMAQANGVWQVYEAARTQRQLPQDSSIPWETLSPKEQEDIRQITGPAPDSIGPEWGTFYALLRWECLDAQHHLAKQITELLHKWQLENQQVELYREIWEYCRLVGVYGRLDFDTFWQQVSGHPGERVALQRAADTITKRTRRLERIAAPPGIERLFAELDGWVRR